MDDRDFYRELIEEIGDGVYFVDRERRITFWNRGAERLSGLRRDQVLGVRCGDATLRHVDESGRLLCDACPLSATMKDGRPRELLAYLQHADGHRVPVRVRSSPIHGPDGSIAGAVEIFEDATDDFAERQRIAELERLALLDPLTRLGNRHYAETQIRAHIREFERTRRSFGTLFLDVDRFKHFNDDHGHEMGDRILSMVGRTLAASVRVYDSVCRWGGDEFVGMIADVDEKTLFAVAEKMRVLVATSGLRLPTETIDVRLSIGATLARHDDSMESLLARADRLMYDSKAAGGNRVTIG
ncbi:MAG: sensor domain-containing diguanylate cyclase [Vicinamibacteria bacterium]|nr:sensor domain-containing diguanylate cyclase [Vicinamibacteria bacterium]